MSANILGLVGRIVVLPTKIPLELYPTSDGIIHEFRCCYGVRGSPILNPIHESCQYIVLWSKGDALRGACTELPEDPWTWSSITVEHARDSKIAKEFI